MDEAPHSAAEANDPVPLPFPQGGSKFNLFPAWMPYIIAAGLMVVVLGQTMRILHLKTQLGTEDAQVTRLTRSNAMMGVRLTAFTVRDAAYQSARIMVAWDPDLNRGVIAMENLPAPAAGHNYQLWVLDPGALAPINAGVVHPETGSRMFAIDAPTTATPGFAITLESVEGSPHPTGSILFAVAPGQ